MKIKDYENKIRKMAMKCKEKGQRTFKPETIDKEYFDGYDFDKFENFNIAAEQIEKEGLIIVHRKKYSYFDKRTNAEKRIIKIEVR